MDRLAAARRGFSVGDTCVPIVPAAILFDLDNGGNKTWGERNPYRDLGIAAFEALGEELRLGNSGAGYGAAAGALKGGLGSASLVDEQEGFAVAALAAVNALGDVVMPEAAQFWAWPFERDQEFGGLPPPQARPPFRLPNRTGQTGGHTTLVVVACDALLDTSGVRRLAIMAQDGVACAIRPAHTPFDGDLVFALATGRRTLEDPSRSLVRLGMMATDCVARAIARGIYEARTIGGLTGYRDDLAARNLNLGGK